MSSAVAPGLPARRRKELCDVSAGGETGSVLKEQLPLACVREQNQIFSWVLPFIAVCAATTKTNWYKQTKRMHTDGTA